MISVILSGGGGTRLWPVSRAQLPKPFIPLYEKTLLEMTYKRLRHYGPIYLVTHQDLVRPSRAALKKLTRNDDKMFAEPASKNTAVAIAWVAHTLAQKNKWDEIVGVFSADHMIGQEKYFHRAVRRAQKWAEKDKIVTVGVKPDHPATGYGYLHLDSRRLESNVYSVRQFVEKPNLKIAQKFLQSKNYFWNAGIFVFKVSQLVSLFEEHSPKLWREISNIKPNGSNLKSVYQKLVAESFDYAVMEKIKKDIVAVTDSFTWSDIGTWDQVAEDSRTGHGPQNHVSVVNLDAQHNFVLSSVEKTVGLVGVRDLIVIDTPDALLIVKKDQAQDVKTLVEKMRLDKRLKKNL